MKTYFLAVYQDKTTKRWKLVTRELKDNAASCEALLTNYKKAKYKTKILTVELPE